MPQRSLMIIGYARVSTLHQDPTRQAHELRAAGAERLFTDIASGDPAGHRPRWSACRESLRAGDTLLVVSLDRLGRSLVDLLTIAEDLRTHEIQLRSLREQIDTGTPVGHAFFVVTAAFAEVQRIWIRENTLSGLAAARAAGRRGGRPGTLTPAKADVARSLLDRGVSLRQAAATVGVSRQALYRAGFSAAARPGARPDPTPPA